MATQFEPNVNQLYELLGYVLDGVKNFVINHEYLSREEKDCLLQACQNPTNIGVDKFREHVIVIHERFPQFATLIEKMFSF
jgi:hypothetical protein